MSFDEIINKAEKARVTITKYASYNTATESFVQNRWYNYSRNGTINFEDKLEKILNNYMLDVFVYDKNGEQVYRRDFANESMQKAPDNHIQKIEVDSPVTINTNKIGDMINNIMAGNYKYRTDPAIDAAMNQSKIDKDELLDMATYIRETIKVTSDKRDIAEAYSKFNNINVDKLLGEHTKKDLLEMLFKKCDDIIKDGKKKNE